jgi:probable HAF family extracellular repeat protein
MTDLGTLGGQFVASGAEGINPAGQVIGQGETAQGELHGFLWEKGVITDLGPLAPRGINPAGQVVVNSTQPPGHALLWMKGVTTDLGTLGGNYSFAEDINASGQVVGQSNTTTGSNTPFCGRRAS